jgi:hypothetical protein
MSATQRTTTERKEIRNRMYAKIHAIWSKLRPDLRKGSADYKEALYVFAEAELKKPQIGSFTELTQTELGRLIDALEHEQTQPPLYPPPANVIAFKPRSRVEPTPAGSQQAEVNHLASLSQRFAINGLFGYLAWSEDWREEFLEKRFRCKRVEMLLYKQAHSCISILLRCAASKYWKSQGKQKVSKPMIAAAIPEVKRIVGMK